MDIIKIMLLSLFICMLLTLSLLYFFNFEEVKKEENFKRKFNSLIKLHGNNKWLILTTVVAGIIIFFIEYYINKKIVIDSLRWQIAGMIMIPIGYIDFKEKIIPNIILTVGLIFTALLILIEIFISPDIAISIVTSSLVGALVAGGIFFIGGVIIRNGVGAGDIKMNFVLGLMVGIVAIYNILLYSTIISAITGIILILTKKKKTKDFLPMAPFTLIGVVLAIILGV